MCDFRKGDRYYGAARSFSFSWRPRLATAALFVNFLVRSERTALAFTALIPAAQSLRHESCNTQENKPIGCSSRPFRHFLCAVLRDDDDNEDDDDDDEEDYIRLSPSTSFVPKRMLSFGPGRSAPSQRKAMGATNSGSTSVHVCTNCSSEFVKWVGKCPTCKEWNTVQEFRVERSTAQSNKSKNLSFSPTKGRRHQSWLHGTDDDAANDGAHSAPVSITQVYQQQMGSNAKDGERAIYRETRLMVPNDDEWNTVLGGGIMPGSLTLLGGDPGVGKSTLLLQTAASVASLSTPPRGIGMGQNSAGETAVGPVLYVSGEESALQIASRAMRLGIDQSELLLLCQTDADFIADIIVASTFNSNADNNDDSEEDALFKEENNNKQPFSKTKRDILKRRSAPSLVVIDSIQTMLCEAGGSSYSAGGVTQVRECVGLFLRLAKSTGIPIVLVGHVTKSGGVAGPRTVEHMVDCVLYLEGSTNNNVRMLRAAKNRFGSCEEVGVYQMNPHLQGRLMPVSDPSSLFLSSSRTDDADGCAISLVLEGMRSMTVEVQALVVSSGGNTSFAGRRTVDGISTSRLLLILAVLQKRYGMSFYRQDVYVNVVGGIRLGVKNDGSGSDLAVAIALVSSLTGIPVRAATAFVGEIGLLGELRSVPSVEKRINEARRMGLSRIVTPSRAVDRNKKLPRYQRKRENAVVGIDWIECDNVLDALNSGLVTKLPMKMGKYGPRLARRKRLTDLDDDDDESTTAPRSIRGSFVDEKKIIIDDDDDDDDDDDSNLPDFS